MDGSGWERVHELEAQLADATGRLRTLMTHLDRLLELGDHMARHEELADCGGAEKWRELRKGW